MKLRILAAAVLAWSCAASAQTVMTGNLFKSLPQEMRVAYVSGVMDASDVNCVPNGVTRKQATDVVMKGVDDNSADRHIEMILLTKYYLMSAFSCKISAPADAGDTEMRTARIFKPTQNAKSPTIY